MTIKQYVGYPQEVIPRPDISKTVCNPPYPYGIGWEYHMVGDDYSWGPGDFEFRGYACPYDWRYPPTTIGLMINTPGVGGPSAHMIKSDPPNLIFGGSNYLWGSTYVEVNNSLNIIIDFPYAFPLQLAGFGFNIPSSETVLGIQFNIEWVNASSNFPEYPGYMHKIWATITVEDNASPCPGQECSFVENQCYDGNIQRCENGCIVTGEPSDCCEAGTRKCVGDHRYYCEYYTRNWVDNGVDRLDPTCPGPECIHGDTKCVDGHYFYCGNGYWNDMGLYIGCPGTECTDGQTECINGNRYDCTNGYWVDQGPDTICPGTGCTGDATHCVGDHRFTCENGYDVDKGVDKTCPGSECTGIDSHCEGEHLIACENGWVVDKGVDDKCRDVPKNNDLLIYGALGAAAVCGLLLLLGGASDEDKKKRKKVN